MVRHSHLLKNFPQFVVIPTVIGFCVINKAEVDVFLEFSVVATQKKKFFLTKLKPLKSVAIAIVATLHTS